METKLTVRPTPYVSIPQGIEVKDHQDLESKIRNGVIDSYLRTQVPIHRPGWVCYKVQSDYSLAVMRARDA